MSLEGKVKEGIVEKIDKVLMYATDRLTYSWEDIVEQDKKSLMRCLYGLGLTSAICFSYSLRDSLNGFEMLMMPLYSLTSWGNGEMATSNVLPTEKIRELDESKLSKSVGVFTTALVVSALSLSASCMLDKETQKVVLPLFYVGLTTFSANTNYYTRRLINKEKIKK